MTSIQLLKQSRFLVRREGRVTWENGIALPSDVQEKEVLGSIVPLSGHDLFLVPEGDRFKQQVWIFTDSDIRENDIVHSNGVNYAVQNIEPWYLGKRIRAMKIDVGVDKERR